MVTSVSASIYIQDALYNRDNYIPINHTFATRNVMSFIRR